MGRLEQAVELEKELLSRMPWLALTLSGNSKLRTLATISHLTRITREERRLISVYIKEAWKSAESMRAKLNELVGEFVTADTDKRRLQIYLRWGHGSFSNVYLHDTYIVMSNLTSAYHQTEPSVSQTKLWKDLLKTPTTAFSTMVMQSGTTRATIRITWAWAIQRPKWRRESQTCWTARSTSNSIVKPVFTWTPWMELLKAGNIFFQVRWLLRCKIPFNHIWLYITTRSFKQLWGSENKKRPEIGSNQKYPSW